MNNEYESVQEYTSEELKQVYESLGLYIPADVKDKAQIADYYLLFDILRVLCLGYGVLNKEQVVDKFYDYYNAPDDKKSSILLPLKNQVADLNYKDEFDGDVAIDDTAETIVRAYELIRLSDDPQAKLHAAEFLYLIENGHNPKVDEDISKYYKLVEEYDAEIAEESANNEVVREQMALEMQARIKPEIIPQYEALTPEEVAAKYLKGAGIVDPAARNSGFRVDRDINID